jgi:aminopeptidase N
MVLMKKAAAFLLLLVCVNLVFAGSYVHHRLTVTLDPAKHSLGAVDRITIPASMVKQKMFFLLNNNLSVQSRTAGIAVTLDQTDAKAEDFGMDREDLKVTSDFKVSKYSVTLPAQTGDATIELAFAGTINYPIQQLGEEYARGFSQTPGIIADKGVYLGGSTYWVPWFSNGFVTFELTTTLAETWDVVSEGKRTAHELKDGKRTTTWNSPDPMEEIYLIAAPFKEYSMSAGSVDVMAFLRTPDEALASKYLEATAQYLEMYRKLVGPYPFSKFALVENFWETGYGMPSFTLLGEQIIRFPFILNSSYPHELLHNYWGNSAYVDFKTGNWCEGLTAYMADHLIAEQRGQADEYRRTTLQKYTDYVNPGNEFPLSKFSSRTNPSSEAIGYGKSMMLWNMLREDVGDEQFAKGFQRFYRDNKFQVASYGNIRKAFESVTGKDLKAFFEQWVDRKGAPELTVSNVSVKAVDKGRRLQFTLKQIQPEPVFVLNVPVAISYGKNVELRKVAMDQKDQTFDLEVPEQPVQVQIDPQFNIFRKLHFNEIPPSLSKVFGSEDILIVLPSKAEKSRLASYEELAKIWSADSSKKITVRRDADVAELPANACVWIFGVENMFTKLVAEGLKDYDAQLTNETARLGMSTYSFDKSSIIITVRHPRNPGATITLLTADQKEAIGGLARKLPHYGKYSYLVFEGAEPANIGKGEWSAVNSPLTAKVPGAPMAAGPELPRRKALAMLAPVFSADRMMKTVNYLASDELQGRGAGSEGLTKAAGYIADKFKSIGLQPGADDGTYFQVWNDVVNAKGDKAPVKNIIGIIPGTNPKFNDESVVVCAHYDHLGLGWPGASKGNEGKIHHGADDNASGVAVMIELAELLAKNLKPQRTVIFAAFTLEESGLKGSKYYVQNAKRFPAARAIGALAIDAVGRLGDKKVLVLNSYTAREWKFIFMGASYVTGVESETVTQELDASDQRSFVDVGVPGVQFFAGATEDYHKPTDVASKIDPVGLVKVATLVREGILYLADREGPMTFQGPATAAQKSVAPAQAGDRRVSTGSMPDFSYSGEGVRLAELSPDSPAAKGGLKKGDIVTKIGQFKVANLREYSDALKNFQPGTIVEIIYLRDGKEQTAKVELIAK